MKLDGFTQISAALSKASAVTDDQPEYSDQEFEFALESTLSGGKAPKQTTPDESDFGLSGFSNSVPQMELIDAQNEEAGVENFEQNGSSGEQILPSVTVPEQEFQQPLAEKAVIGNMVAFRTGVEATGNDGNSIGEVDKSEISSLTNPASRQNSYADMQKQWQNPGNTVFDQKTATVLPEQKSLNGAVISAPTEANALPSAPNNQRADGNKSPALQNVSSMKIENDVKYGGVKLEGTTPANFSQLIINSIAPNAKTEAIATMLPINEKVSTQLPKTLTVQLLPRSLGIVEVRITNLNGRLNITVETSTVAAEKLLRAEMPILAEKLLMTGITYDEMTVKNNPNLEQFRDKNWQERLNSSNSNYFDTSDHGKNLEQDSYREFLKPDSHQSRYSNDLDAQTTATDRDAISRKGIYL